MKKSSTKILSGLLVLVVLGLIFILGKTINKPLGGTSEDVPFYQYSAGFRYDYETTANLSYDEKTKVSSYMDGPIKYNIDYSPMYYKNKMKFMMPNDFSVVTYDGEYGFQQNKMLHLSTIEKNNQGLVYKMNLDEGFINDAFLYDGDGMYVILSDAYYVMDGISYRISPFSFVDYKEFNKYLRIYDYAKDEMTVFENVSKVKLVIPYIGIIIDLDNDVVSLEKLPDVKQLLMSSIDFLEVYGS